MRFLVCIHETPPAYARETLLMIARLPSERLGT
jgi:hypothetical protein